MLDQQLERENRVVRRFVWQVLEPILPFLMLVALLCSAAIQPSLADTILIFKGGQDPVDFNNPVTLTFESEITKVYTNKTGSVIKDLHFSFDPANGLVGFMTDYFDDFDYDPKGVLYSAYAGKTAGIPKDEVFSIHIRGVFPKDTKAVITPTFTGRTPEPGPVLLVATGLVLLAFRWRR
jgi:hypothetical protein